MYVVYGRRFPEKFKGKKKKIKKSKSIFFFFKKKKLLLNVASILSGGTYRTVAKYFTLKIY